MTTNLKLVRAAQSDYNRLTIGFNKFISQLAPNSSVILYNRWVGPPPLISPTQTFKDYQPLMQAWVSSFSPGPGYLDSGSTNGVENVVYSKRITDPDPNVSVWYTFLMTMYVCLGGRGNYNPPEPGIKAYMSPNNFPFD